MDIIKRIKDWWNGWSESKKWEDDALHLIEVIRHDGAYVNRNHPYNDDCWCTGCCSDKATQWINEYWERRLHKSRVKATMRDGTLVCSIRGEE